MARTKKSSSSPKKYKKKSPCKTPKKQMVGKKKSPKKCVVSKKKSPCKSPRRSNSVKFYCVKVRKPVMVMPEDISVAKTKNGRHMLKGWCPEHQCYLYKFIKDCDVEKMINKYGKC